jgi:hypothetical protein
MAKQSQRPQWKFLTNHALVLVCIADDPGVRLRDISERLDITERAAHRIVAELVADGYIKRERRGRRNHYTIESAVPLPARVGRLERVGDLLAILSDTGGASRSRGPASAKASSGGKAGR